MRLDGRACQISWGQSSNIQYCSVIASPPYNTAISKTCLLLPYRHEIGRNNKVRIIHLQTRRQMLDGWHAGKSNCKAILSLERDTNLRSIHYNVSCYEEICHFRHVVKLVIFVFCGSWKDILTIQYFLINLSKYARKYSKFIYFTPLSKKQRLFT